MKSMELNTLMMLSSIHMIAFIYHLLVSQLKFIYFTQWIVMKKTFEMRKLKFGLKLR